METGAHVNSDYVEFFECVAFRLEPETSKSSNNLDGEQIEDGPIQARIMPGAIQFFTGELGGEKLT
jgi:sphingosine kinase